MSVFSLVAKLSLLGAQEAREGLKSVKDEAKGTGDAAKKAGSDIDSGLTGPFKMLDAAANSAGMKLGKVAAELESKMPRALKMTAAGINEIGGGIAKFSEKFGGALSIAGGHLARFGGILGGIAGRAAGLLTLVGGAIGASFGKAAMDAAIQFTELNARLEAVTGSAQKAAEKLAFAQAVANPSNFTFTQLANATVTLEAFGLRAERVIPTIARLGMAFGAGNEQLEELTRAIGALGTGKFLESDVAARFGLNRSLFEQKGIKFDGQGQLLSSATETLDALEKIVNEKYGGIFDKIANTPGAKLASLGDAFEKLQRIVGDGILKVVVPGIERLTSLVSALGSSGVALDAVSSAVAGIQKIMGGAGENDFMTRFVAGALSVVAMLPDAAAKFSAYLSSAFTTIFENTKTLFTYIYELTKPLLDVIGGIATAFGHLGLDAAMLIAKAVGAMDASAKSEMPTLKSLPNFPQLGLLSKQDDYFNRLSSAMKTPVDNSVPAARGSWLTGPIAKKQDDEEPTNLLGMIAKNTGKSADLLSLRAQATGTGASNVIGPTAAELQGGGTRRLTLDTTSAENHLTRFFKEIAIQVFNGAIGSGYEDRAF